MRKTDPCSSLLSAEMDASCTFAIHSHGKPCESADGEGSARSPFARKTSISPPPVASANASNLRARCSADNPCVAIYKSPRRSARRSSVCDRPLVSVLLRTSHIPQPKRASAANVTPQYQMVSRREMERWASNTRGSGSNRRREARAAVLPPLVP